MGAIYPEEDFLQLSGLQHFKFCRRQWALIHIENQWAENLRTTDGAILHERAHDGVWIYIVNFRYLGVIMPLTYATVKMFLRTFATMALYPKLWRTCCAVL